MVESNETVSSKTVLSALGNLTDLQVTDSSGVSHTITLVNSELVAGTGTYIFFIFHYRLNSCSFISRNHF